MSIVATLCCLENNHEKQWPYMLSTDPALEGRQHFYLPLTESTDMELMDTLGIPFSVQQV